MIPAIVFSRDRACQLDALLQTLPDVFSPVHVLYTTSSLSFADAYRECMRLHPAAVFVEQTSFRSNVEDLLPTSGSVCFFTDDDIVYGPVDERAVEEALTAEQVAAFSLRLGLNTTHCYPHDQPQPCPPSVVGAAGLVMWQWPEAEFDFSYPLSLDGHVLRAGDIRMLLDGVDYGNPNQLEDALAQRARALAATRPVLASFKHSVLLGVPANRVNETHPNRHAGGTDADVETLNDRFLAGWRIEPALMDYRDVSAAHQEIPYVFWRAA